MEMHQVRYFLAMARDLNFTRAAGACNVSQPSLTKAIQKLEDEFGGPLFRRERARTHLTDLGRLMLPLLERTYEAAQAAKSLARDVGKAQVAPLALGVASSIESPALDEVLAELGSGLAGFKLTLRSGASQALTDEALAGDLDLILIEAPDDAPERLESWSLYPLQYRLVLKAGHPLTGHDAVELADTCGESWIDCGGAGFAAACAAAAANGLELNVRHSAHDQAQLRRLLLSGLGCAFTAMPSNDPRLDTVRIADLADSRPAILASIAGRRRSTAADAFVRAARARGWSAASA